MSAASGTVVRDAVADDLQWLVDCAIAMAWETERKRLDAGIVRAGVAAALDDTSKARYFVAMRDDARAGTLMLTGEWSDWRNGLWWWIQSVYVEPAQRRGGVFAALYRHVETLARAASGVIGLRLYVEHANAAAQRTYAVLGMRDAGYRIYEQLL
jgi:GNAT superfamily N-acetyltransferase